MRVVVIEAPTEIISVDEAKKFLIIDQDITDDDDLIKSFILAATQWLDGPEGWLGRALGIQVLEWQRCNWPTDRERLPFPPEVEIISIKYIDPDGIEQTWPLPTPLHFDDLPAVRGRDGDVKIRYRAGYGTQDPDAPDKWNNAVPEPIRTAIKMLVAQWYNVREPVVSTGQQPFAMPFAVEALLSPYRVW
ncbi:putative phiE125 gp8 family phage protein [Rhizobium sp. ERR 1071]|uniref:head-tail connector protein n=1 Tax=Rhizobium sp. ERR 1071 TaxID=2572677 RepID=UPI001199406D|nr:head-tail connector protein [Rhizobium sp. ERR1071]TWB20047.1 putative phiE125 gp8 family phage protein [Rhizobium sp. ERR1071]